MFFIIILVQPATGKGGKNTSRDSEAKMNQCSLCPNAYKSTQGLNGHMKVHTGEHKCITCQFSAPNYGSYSYHLATAHAQSYRCRICSKEDSNPPLLIAHILSHNEVREEAHKVMGYFQKITH